MIEISSSLTSFLYCKHKISLIICSKKIQYGGADDACTVTKLEYNKINSNEKKCKNGEVNNKTDFYTKILLKGSYDLILLITKFWNVS